MGSSIQAQSGAFLRGEVSLKQGDWEAAIPHLEKALFKKDEWAVAEPLGFCYSKVGNLEGALGIYQFVESTGALSDTSLLHCTALYLKNGQFHTANQFLKINEDRVRHLKRYTLLRQEIERSLALMGDSLLYNLIPVSIESDIACIGPIKFGKGLILAVQKEKKNKYELHYGERKNAFSLAKPKSLQGWGGSKESEGPACISKDQKTIFYTKTFRKFPDPNGNKPENGISKIMERKWTGRKWGPEQQLNFNSDFFSCAHPAISEDGKTMVFVSNRPGGMGGTDLYQVKMGSEGWGLPENLGRRINTPEDELFPTFMSKSVLYFSSSGHAGLGEQDIFVSEVKNGEWTTPINLGYPLNSHQDDFGLILSQRGRVNYFCSNRSGVEKIIGIQFRNALELMIVDSLSQLPVPGVKVNAISSNRREYLVVSDEKGMTRIPFDGATGALVDIEAEGYAPRRIKIPRENTFPGLVSYHTVDLKKNFDGQISGFVFDRISGTPISKAQITCFYGRDEVEKSLFTGEDGAFELNLGTKRKYFIEIKHEDFKSEIFEFDLTRAPRDTFMQKVTFLTNDNYFTIDGQVEELVSGRPLEEIEVKIIDNLTLEEIALARSNRQGVFWMSIPLDSTKSYSILASSNNYFSERMDLRKIFTSGEELVIRMEIAEKGDNKLIKTVYFENAKSQVQLLSPSDLSELKYFMEDNPDSSLEIASHTDSKGSSAFNLKLSRKRSESVKQFILENALIDPNRILTVGYGESQLVNECDNSHTCSDEEHRLNRRSEIRVIR